MKSEIINGKEYREVTLRGRTKLIASDGSAVNPKRRKQKATTYINKDGYLCFGGGVPVHLYVAYGLVEGYFDGAEVNHKDFNRKNNNASNLELVTHVENIKYSVLGNYDVWKKSKQGINNGRSNFTESDVLNIRNMYDNGMSVADIVRYYHPDLVHAVDYKNIHSTFLNICKRKTWKHI